MQISDEQLQKVATVLTFPYEKQSKEIQEQIDSFKDEIIKFKELSTSKKESTEKYNEYCQYANDMLVKNDVENDPANFVIFIRLLTHEQILLSYVDIPIFEKLVIKYSDIVQNARKVKL